MANHSQKSADYRSGYGQGGGPRTLPGYPVKLHFGRYAGTRVDQVPAYYLLWLADDFSPRGTDAPGQSVRQEARWILWMERRDIDTAANCSFHTGDKDYARDSHAL